MALGFAKGAGTIDVTGTLEDSESGGAVVGRVVRFFLNGQEVGIVTTDDTGSATVALPRNAVKKDDVVRVQFDGDADFAPSAAQRTVPKGL